MTKIVRFKKVFAKELSQAISETIRPLEKKNPGLDYSAVYGEDTPEALVEADKLGPMWVALEKGKIIGTVSLHNNRLRRFFVHPDYQRKGVGRKLVQALVAYAKTKKFNEITVGAVLDAVAVYEKLGFKIGQKFLNPEINPPEMAMTLSLLQ